MKIISKERLGEILEEIENSLNSCNCSDVANNEIRNLNNQNREARKEAAEERREMLDRMDKARTNYQRLLESQSSIIETEKRENSVVRKENVGLQQMLGLTKAQVEALEKQLIVKKGQLELNNRQMEQLRKAFTEMAVENAKNHTEALLIREQLN